MVVLFIFVTVILISLIIHLISRRRRCRAYSYVETLRGNHNYIKSTNPKMYYDWIEYIIRVLGVSDITDIEVKESIFGYRIKYNERTWDWRSNGFGHYDKFYKINEKYLRRNDGTFKDSEFFSSKESVKKAKEGLLDKALTSILTNTAQNI